MKQLIFIGLANICCWYVSAQTLDKQEMERMIDSICRSIDLAGSPGVAIILMEKGRIITKKQYGMANLEHQIPFTHQTPVRLAYSGGREFMCAGLALMKMEGLLHFDDKVRQYFPKLPEWSDDVVIRDLLNHSSGFVDEWATLLLMHADMTNRLDKEQLLTLLYDQPKPQVEPGKGYMYCNSDFALLRFIMEAASKQSLPDYLKKNLFDPLGMSSTFMNDDLELVIPGMADNYAGSRGYYYKMRDVKTSPGGNYRIVTTADDLAKWAIALDDPTSLLAKAMAELYPVGRAIPVLSPESHYTFGHEWHDRHQTALVKHGGVNQDFYMFRVPSKQITVIGLGNAWVSMWTAMQMADILYPGPSKVQAKAPEFPDTPVVVDTIELKKYAGRYFEHKQPNFCSHLPDISFCDIRLENNGLQFYYTLTGSFPITPFGEGLFKDMEYDLPFRFIQSHPDSVIQLHTWTPDGEQLIYSSDTSALQLTPTYLQAFTGQYHSPHLDYYCRIILNEKGQLILRRPTLSDKIVIPIGKDQFLFEMDHRQSSWYVKASFSRDENGDVNGIEMQHNRMLHHRFNKVK